MSDRSAIEWTDATWNPVRGCTKVSPGCKFCYAEVFAERFRGVAGHPFEQGFDLRLVSEKLDQPLHWRRPRKISSVHRAPPAVLPDAERCCQRSQSRKRRNSSRGKIGLSVYATSVREIDRSFRRHPDLGFRVRARRKQAAGFTEP
jgi:hypothetical protein